MELVSPHTYVQPRHIHSVDLRLEILQHTAVRGCDVIEVPSGAFVVILCEHFFPTGVIVRIGCDVCYTSREDASRLEKKRVSEEYG